MGGEGMGRVCYLGARSSFKRVKGSAPFRMAIITTMRSARPTQSIQLVRMLIFVFFVLPVALFSTTARVPNTAPPPLKSLHEPGMRLETIHKPHAKESQSSILRRLPRGGRRCVSLGQFAVMQSFPLRVRTAPKAAGAAASQKWFAPADHRRFSAQYSCAPARFLRKNPLRPAAA